MTVDLVSQQCRDAVILAVLFLPAMLRFTTILPAAVHVVFCYSLSQFFVFLCDGQLVMGYAHR